MDRRSCAPSSIFRPLSSLGRARQVAKSISNITIKLLLFCLLLLSGEAFAQTTTIRGGGSDNVAEVSSGALAGTEKGLVIRCASGCAGSGGTSATDKGVFTASTTLGTPAMGAMDDVASSTCGEDQACITRMTANRAIHVNLRDALGNELSIGGGTQYAQGTVATDTDTIDRKSTRLNSSHQKISYAVFC